MEDFFSHIGHELQLPLTNPILIFSLILLIILLSPTLLKKFSIPSVIGLIISGVIIGPYGLYLLEKNEAIDLFSTIGLLYIMFIAGIELDMNEFRINKNKSILFGVLTFILPMGIGYPVCYYLLHYDMNASLLTASSFATHTLIAYPAVSRLGVSKNQAVAVTIGGTILADTVVLIILAVIVGNSKGSLNQEFWIRLGVSLTIFSCIMFIIVPRVAKWFFRELESEKHSHYIFVLSIVFFASFLAEVAGLEPIIGAFVAGLALNRLIPYSSPLMNRIEFIGNSLFIPFFLISVGMLVDISAILKGPALIIAATVTLVAIIGKWMAAFFTQKILRYTRTQRQLIFGLSNAHASATLAVILVGYEAGILDENILNGTVCLILVTCAVASFVTEKAAKKIKITETDYSEITEQKEEDNDRILFPVIHMNGGIVERLLQFAVYVKDKKSANPISALRVISSNEAKETDIVAKTKDKLEAIVKQGSASDSHVEALFIVDHNVASGIARASRQMQATLIIMEWEQSKKELFTGWFATKTDNIANMVDKTIFLCTFNKPVDLHKRILVTAPPYAEYDAGFKHCLLKLTQLCKELSATIVFYCNTPTKLSIEGVLKSEKISIPSSFVMFDDWEDFLIMIKEIKPDDIFVLISARQGSPAYAENLEKLPEKISKHFSKYSRILIYPHYPKQTGKDEILHMQQYEDISTKSLTAGVETIQKIGKSIGNIFKF